MKMNIITLVSNLNYSLGRNILIVVGSKILKILSF